MSTVQTISPPEAASPIETMSAIVKPSKADVSETVLLRYPLFKRAVARIQECFESWGTTAEPLSLAIVGESGAGKTTIIKYFHSLHPDIPHGWDIEQPVQVATVPPGPTVKSLAETLLIGVGDCFASRGNTVNKSIRLREYWKRRGVHLLALDDFQHFVDTRRNVALEVADWLKDQIEEAQMPIVVSGLRRGLEVFATNEQLRRRFNAPLRVGEFNWDNAQDRAEYRGILRALWHRLSAYQMPPLEKDMVFHVHYACWGLLGYTMELVRGAIRIARRQGTTTITTEMFAEAFQELIDTEELNIANHPNPFLSSFDVSTAPTLVMPSEQMPPDKELRHRVEVRA